jgi:hypothetical protein
MATNEITEAHSILYDVHHLMNLIHSAAAEIADGCHADRDGTLKAFELGDSIRVVSGMITGKVEEALALIDKAAVQTDKGVAA